MRTKDYFKTGNLLSWFILLRLILDTGYILFVNKYYSYDGFVLDVNYLKYIESHLLLIICYLVLPKDGSKPSTILLHVYLILIVVPLLSFYGLANKERWMLYLLLSGFLLMTILTALLTFLKIKIKPIKRLNLFILCTMFFITILFILHVVISGGFSHFSLDLSKVYEHRESAGETVYVGIWGYLTNWVVKVVNLALAGWFLYKGRRTAFLLCILLQVVYFGVTTHKSILFSIFLVPMFFYLYTKPKPLKVLVIGIACVLFTVLFFAQYTDNIFLGSMLVRRLFYVPTNLSFVYLEFFSVNEPVLMSNSILSNFFEYPYDVSTARLIGGYLGQPDMAANNGFIASGYMHFKVIGVLIFPMIVSFILFFIDSVSERLPTWLCLSIIIGPFISLFTSSDLGTTLLTHGLLLSVFILYGLSSNETKLVIS